MKEKHKITMGGRTDFGSIYSTMILIYREYKSNLQFRHGDILTINLIRHIRNTTNELQIIKNRIREIHHIRQKNKKSPFYFVDLN